MAQDTLHQEQDDRRLRADDQPASVPPMGDLPIQAIQKFQDYEARLADKERQLETLKSENRALATTYGQGALTPMQVVDAIIEQRAAIDRLISTCFIEGVHYGKPFPGAPKNTLLIPGAELFLAMFRVRPEFECISKTDDLAAGVFAYEYRCRLINTVSGQILGEAIGSCTSKEDKYAFRNGERVCPECDQATIYKAKDGGGWYCWTKKGGCGAKFGIDDKRIADQIVGKVANTSIYDVRNTVNKQAQNRALKKSVATMGGLSGMFEAMIDDDDEESGAKQAQHQSGNGEKKKYYPKQKPSGTAPALTTLQVQELVDYATKLLPSGTAFKPTDIRMACLSALELRNWADPFDGTLDEAKAKIKTAIEKKFAAKVPASTEQQSEAQPLTRVERSTQDAPDHDHSDEVPPVARDTALDFEPAQQTLTGQATLDQSFPRCKDCGQPATKYTLTGRFCDKHAPEGAEVIQGGGSGSKPDTLTA